MRFFYPKKFVLGYFLCQKGLIRDIFCAKKVRFGIFLLFGCPLLGSCQQFICITTLSMVLFVLDPSTKSRAPNCIFTRAPNSYAKNPPLKEEEKSKIFPEFGVGVNSKKYNYTRLSGKFDIKSTIVQSILFIN